MKINDVHLVVTGILGRIVICTVDKTGQNILQEKEVEKQFMEIAEYKGITNKQNEAKIKKLKSELKQTKEDNKKLKDCVDIIANTATDIDTYALEQSFRKLAKLTLKEINKG